jgi:hypothetical protein
MDRSLYRALAESASARRGWAAGSAGEGHSSRRSDHAPYTKGNLGLLTASRRFGEDPRDRDAVTNGDGIFTDQNFFNQESHDSRAFDDTERFGGAAQASKEYGEGFCQA